MMEIVEHIARALLAHAGKAPDIADIASTEEHRIAHLFMVMHAALHDFVAPCADCPIPAEMPNNPSDAQPVEEPPAAVVPDTVDHAESDSVEAAPEEVAPPVTSES